MDEIRNCSTLLLIIFIAGVSASNGVFSVKYRYAGRERSLSDLKAHDDRRQLRILAGVDLLSAAAVVLMVSGFIMLRLELERLQRTTMFRWILEVTLCGSIAFNMDLTLYNIQDSVTGKLVPCDQEFCYEKNPAGDLSRVLACGLSFDADK
ncbi:hypothetical protein GH714_007480 [Hevea brasiliensis]|uniref:Uncharacterized protein n=1 Tax=Hevea brasiliensis TaxID=3981 RepID=A0A6A6NG58_HEVBR|nr:hypothetical protein GH714_007480 [Hevea brasiliensis]